jgi:hypothetical protein
MFKLKPMKRSAFAASLLKAVADDRGVETKRGVDYGPVMVVLHSGSLGALGTLAVA